MPQDTLPTKEEWSYWLSRYAYDVNHFNNNKDRRHPDDAVCIVGVMVFNSEGEQGRMFCQKMAHGKNAYRAARDAERFRDGWDKKIEKLDSLANDPKLQRRHETRYKSLKKWMM